jgi:hypothetical protein
MKSALERTARRLWAEWGSAWMLHTRCSCCGEVRACRGPRRSLMVCLPCFDQGDYGR